MAEGSNEHAKDGEVAALLRAALEKIVFFEWRISELSGEVAAAEARCASAERARNDAEETTRAAQQAARRQVGELEAERARLTTLLGRPAHPAIDTQALEAERNRSARIEADLADARAQIERNRSERERWLAEMIDQARTGDEAPAALAQFISELRGEVIALRERQRQCDAALAAAGIAVPPAAPTLSHGPACRPAAAIEEARRMLAEGRLGAGVEEIALPSSGGVAARALAEQCLRALSAPDAARRAQAARHLAAVPFPGAAPALTAALHTERDPKARAQLARALAACGGETAAGIVAAMQEASEAPLVRLAALEALAQIASRAETALRTASLDESAAVRRRAAALAAALGFDAILTRLASDADATVRGASQVARTESEAPVPEARPAQAARPGAAARAVASVPPQPVTPTPAPATAGDFSADAILAVQAAIFGLTEEELAARTGMARNAATELARKLVAEGRLGRRGKRLVLAEGGAA